MIGTSTVGRHVLREETNIRFFDEIRAEPASSGLVRQYGLVLRVRRCGMRLWAPETAVVLMMVMALCPCSQNRSFGVPSVMLMCAGALRGQLIQHRSSKLIRLRRRRAM